MIHKVKKNLDTKSLIIIGVFLFTITIYIKNLSPSVLGGDSGDFITAAITKGVPHPSGYPLLTMIGILFVNLPINATPAWKFGLTSSIFSSLACVFFYMIVHNITRRKILAIVASLSLAFTYTFWLYAEFVEAFALNSLFILILTYFTFRHLETKDIKFLYLISFFAGLSLTNNLSILFIFPSILLTIIMKNQKKLLDLKLLTKAFFLFFLGLAPYLYLLVASFYDPLLNWGYPYNLVNLFKTIFRTDYGWQGVYPNLKQSGVTNKLSLLFYWEYLKLYVNPIIILFSPLGFFYLVKQKKYLILIFLITALIVSGPYFASYPYHSFTNLYQIGSVEKFYITSIIFLTIFASIGFVQFKKITTFYINRKLLKTITSFAVIAVLSIVPLSSYYFNAKRVNFKNIFIGDNLAIDLLASLPPYTILTLNNDSQVFNTLYYQNAYDFRTDVYLPGRHNGFSEIFKLLGLSNEINNSYRKQLRNKINPLAVTSNFVLFLNKKPIYSAYPESLENKRTGNIISIPYGLSHKVLFEKDFNLSLEEYIRDVNFVFDSYHTDHILENKDIIKDNFLLADISKLYSIAYFDVSKFIKDYYGSPEISTKYLNLSTQLDPLRF